MPDRLVKHLAAMRAFNRDIFKTNALPVVARELRAESRRPINYWLRVFTAAVIVGVFAGYVATTKLSASELGPSLFSALDRALSVAIWVVVPMMTADCISSEKREGTLGLLFLTPLTVLDVIIGKAATHMLRATTVVLASLPVLVLPFVAGGVSWQHALWAVAGILNALLLAMAAGLYASANGGSVIQVMVMAECYSLYLALFSGFIHFFFDALAGRNGFGLIFLLAVAIAPAVILFPLLLKKTVRKLRETWDRDSAAPEQPRWVATFSDSEFWRSAFRWERGPALDRNPMVWLQEYSWTARLTKWGWVLAILAAEFVMLVALPGLQPQVTIALSLGVAFSAAGSFRRERQSGLLEVLLVTPLSVRQLAAGRLWGIFVHFFPAIALLLFCWNSERNLGPKAFFANPFVLVTPNPLAFAALMVTGLYLSLWRGNFLLLWLATWALAFFLPAAATMALHSSTHLPMLVSVGVASAFQVALAFVCWLLLCRNMKQRRFISADTFAPVV